jgi:hypothetical protein
MLVTRIITWQAVSWPLADAATRYQVFENGVTQVADVSDALTASVTYDDSLPGVVYIIRPTDGSDFGPSQAIVFANQPLNNRAWLRSYVRKAMSDRIDDGKENTPTLSDDELNEYINDAIRNYSVEFPLERDYTITLLAGGELAGARDYQLPTDCQKVIQARYNQANSHLELYLKEASFKGGETTATSWIGYPKLGIIQPPIGGRYYPGHFDVYENRLHLDFDPLGNGDTLSIRYLANYPYPTDDLSAITIPTNDIEMLTLYVEGKAWLAIEGKDVRLSRWRTKDDGGRRDDMPTEKMSTRMFNAWNVWLNQRRSIRPKVYRLVRR